MRQEIAIIFGDPIPSSLKHLAAAVDSAIAKAVAEVPEVAEARRDLANMGDRLRSLHEEKTDEMYLHPRNIGSHSYPGIIAPNQFLNTSDCKYCKCWMGHSRSGGPEGVDPFGACPGNPKLRDAYELLKLKLGTVEAKFNELKKHLGTTIEMKTN